MTAKTSAMLADWSASRDTVAEAMSARLPLPREALTSTPVSWAPGCGLSRSTWLVTGFISDAVTDMGADVRFGPARWTRLAVALINTAPYERQEDLLTSAGQLRELLLAHDEPGPVEVDDHDLADARQARNALAAVFSARDNPGQVAALLNQLLARTAQPRLVTHEGVPLHLHVDAPGASWEAGWPPPAPWA
jgi:hypothetical protein